MEVKHATPNFETRILNSVLSAISLSDYDIDLIMILVDILASPSLLKNPPGEGRGRARK